MRVVLDSNILFSALISPHGVPDQIYRAWRSGRFELVTSLTQLDEIRKASRYPKLKAILQPSAVGTMINNLQRARVLEVLEDHFEVDDPYDGFLLAMASQGNADFLVTGDKRAGLLELGHIGRAQILTPNRFCDQVLQRNSNRIRESESMYSVAKHEQQTDDDELLSPATRENRNELPARHLYFFKSGFQAGAVKDNQDTSVTVRRP